MTTMNLYELINIPIEKFIKAFSDVINGKCNYRTIDKRLLNFRDGTEVQQYRYKINRDEQS